MGPKITIDSATLMNKGLELIEAHFLFGLPYDRIEVVVHPTSIVHGLVRFRDGAAIAHLGYPDMRVPISYALTYPERAETPVPSLDLTAGPLEFFEPDIETFRMLALARDAGERGGTYPCAYNAANEEAVGAFDRGVDGLQFGCVLLCLAGRQQLGQVARRRPVHARDLHVAAERDRADPVLDSPTRRLRDRGPEADVELARRHPDGTRRNEVTGFVDHHEQG
jgi:hypothetical protein